MRADVVLSFGGRTVPRHRHASPPRRVCIAEGGPSRADRVQAAKHAPRYTPHGGMAMFGLQAVQLYWERALDTKARAR